MTNDISIVTKQTKAAPNRAVSIRWTGLGTGLWDWTVGLDSQKVALILSSDTGNIQLPTYRGCEFLVATQLSFRCEIAHDRGL